MLLGPPGSGKSTIGEVLASRGWRWRDWEGVLLQQWGSRDAFVENKETALPALHEDVRRWLSSDATTAVLETTGLSDAALLDELDAAGEAFFVRLDVPEAEAIRRVSARERGRHLTDDPDLNRAVWRAFRERGADRRVDLVIDTAVTSPQTAAAAIEAALDP